MKAKTGGNALDSLEPEDSQEDSVDSLDEIPLAQPNPVLHEDAEALSTSASEILFAELSEKTELLKIAQVKAEEYKSRCDALASKLSASKKRQRDESSSRSAQLNPSADVNPKKKASPETAESTTSVVPPKPLPVGAFAQDSDDDVPMPGSSSKSPPEKPNNRLFESLQSILCGYKDKKICPGSKNLPFEICAEMCKEEADEMLKWNLADKRRMHKSVLSAIRLVYPNKKESWYSSQFLLNPAGAAQYWSRVLLRRAEIWRAAANRSAAPASTARPKSLKEKIREKIAQRRASRIRNLLPPPASAPADDPFKTPICRKKSVLSSSESDDDERRVIDLSISPSAASASSSDKAKSPSPSHGRLAPRPSYVCANFDKSHESLK